MATAWRKVKNEHDLAFTIKDMLKVYYGNSDYAKYDHSVCQWNQFLKDFCADENSRNYLNKLKVASTLWKEVRNSSNEKSYSKNLLTEYADEIKEYGKQKNQSKPIVHKEVSYARSNRWRHYWFCLRMEQYQNKGLSFISERLLFHR